MIVLGGQISALKVILWLNIYATRRINQDQVHAELIGVQ